MFPIKPIGSTITIKFKHIDEIGGGLTALGPATCDIDLGKLDKNEYSIKFKLNGEKSSGTLYTNPLKLEISEKGNIKLK